MLLLVPTLLKTHLKVDEVVTTLLLNFVVLLLANYLLFGPWKDPMAMGWPQGAPIIDEGSCPTSWPRPGCMRAWSSRAAAVAPWT